MISGGRDVGGGRDAVASACQPGLRHLCGASRGDRGVRGTRRGPSWAAARVASGSSARGTSCTQIPGC